MRKTINRVACLIRRPFFVHIIIDARKRPQYGPTPAIEADVGANRVHHVDAWCLFQLPWACFESIGFRCQRTHWTQVNDIARKLALHGVLQIGRDLRILAATNRADFFNASDFFREPNATCALDATRHRRFDDWSHIFFGNRTLVFFEARSAATISHALVLQIAFTALVANRAIQRVIDEQKLHHTFACLFNHRAVGLDDLPFGGGQSTACLRLWRPRGNLDQAHAAIARNGQPLMIAKARNFLPRHLTRLKHSCACRNFEF